MAFIYLMVVLASAVFQTGFCEMLNAVPECPLIQYIEIGTRGLVQCSFNEGFLAVTWYNVNQGKPILLYKDGVKSGDGYYTGEFDIHPNGSLVIHNVGVEHESVYRISKAISVSEPTVSYAISVYTTVIPAATIPAIDPCPYVFGSVCVLLTVHQIAVTCSIRDSRPAVNLSWKQQTHRGDDILASTYMNLTNNNVTYTSRATTKFFFENSNFLALLVCQASSVPLNLMKQENIILIERQTDYKSMYTPDKTYVKIHQRMYLPCNDRTLNLLMWKRSRGREDDVETMFVSIFQPSNLTQLTYKEYQLEVDGSISLQNTLLEHEGLYACLHDNGVSGGIKLHNVSVIVDPIPAFPVVDGCNHQQYCVLEKEPRDQLTCSVLGIRPEVSLEWRAFRQETPIVFTHNVLKVTKEGDGYDVSLTVNFDITLTVQEKITVECHVVGDNSEFFSLSTKVDLLFNNVLLRDRDSNILTIAIIVGALITLTVIISVVLVFMCRKRRVRRRIRKREPNDVQENAIEEATPMMKVVNDDSQQRYDENKEELFIDQLKRKYEILYDAVQPIPYIKDRMYCVDKVFVEGGMEYLDKTTVAKQGKEWKQMKSYNELTDGTRIGSTRKILEGEPGYGKSTLTLQLVYDWCKGVTHSPLKQIKILILLRLRQLGGVNSIFEAVRRFILPGDSEFTDDEVKSIIKNCSSVMLVLDGYDEYPDQDKTQSDVYKIIRNDIFREIKVILTTRSSYLPRYRSPQTDRARLTGFDDLARDKYIRKAVTGDDDEAVDEIKRKLQENPVLGDLCEVPLFFVMFAHITHENKELQTFHSVTGFFRYMISCFHSHMWNKMKDENVKTIQRFETKHSKLDEIAFNALSGKDQRIVWQKQNMCKALGKAFYNQYVRIGILVEEEVLDMFSMPDAMGEMRSTVEVRFYHKLFCEWYAAHHLARKITKFNSNTSSLLVNLDPFDLQYVYRFACGLNKAAARKIIKYLQKNNEGQKFAMLCILEQEGDNDELLESVTELVSNSITINVNDSKLLQRSVTQILEFASKKEIPITSVCLNKSFKECEGDVIILHSALRLTQLLTVEKIHIKTEQVNMEPRILTEEDVTKIVRYGLRSEHLKDLSFAGCTLPLSFSSESLPIYMRSRDIKVCWSLLDSEVLLNVQSGQWEVKDKDSLRQLCSEEVVINARDQYLPQWLSTISVHTASNNNIPISRLYLEKSFSKIDAGNIILHSGLRLPCPVSVKQVVIHTKERREMTETECLDIMLFVKQTHMLEQIEFDGCLLPVTFSTESIPAEMQSRDIKVFWNDYGYSLNLQSGVWEVDSEDVVRKLCINQVNIHRDDSELLQRCTIQLLENASNYDIPISSVYLYSCSPRVDESGLNLILQSGLSLSILSSLQKLMIYDNYRGLTNEELAVILSYSSQCTSLKELKFRWYIPPDTIPVGSIPSSLKTRNVKVWNYSPYRANSRRLNLQTGRWQVSDENGNLPGEEGFHEKSYQINLAR